MTAYKVVVDGSNVATEGRTRPSLAQLDEAVRSFLDEYPNADVIVIVDSSFPNRIDPADVSVFEEAFLAGEIITPPAGTVGRGDAFILKVADKLGATVFSNDSFQEFHGTYDWLFEKGRLVGGKPIPGLGWVFTPRVPVRGQKSREAVREAKRQTVRVGSPEAMRPMPVPKAPPPFQIKDRTDAGTDGYDEASDADPRRRRKKRRGSRDSSRDNSRDVRENRDSRGDVVVSFDEDSIDQARPGREPDAHGREGESASTRPKRRQRGRVEGNPAVAPKAVNEPGTFLTFIASHLPGSAVDGTVEDYASHGFYVTAGGARCYVPLAGLAEPMPRSAKEVVRRGESRNFIVKAFDAVRRGIELALVGTPGAGEVDSVPTATESAKKGRVAKNAQVAKGAGEKSGRVTKLDEASKQAKAAAGGAKKSAAKQESTKAAVSGTTEKSTARKTVAPRSGVSTGVPAVKNAAVKKSAAPTGPLTKAVVKKVAVKKAAVKKASVKKAAVTKASVKKAAVTKAAGTEGAVKNAAVKNAAVKNAAVKNAAVKNSAVKNSAVKKFATTASAIKVASVKKAPAKKVAPKKAVAKRTPAKKAEAPTALTKKAVPKKAAAKR